MGPTITTSASLKEDDKFIAEWVGCKVLGVDRETSILYLLSHLYNIGAGAILVVSDHLIKRISYSISKEYERRVQKAFNEIINSSFRHDSRYILSLSFKIKGCQNVHFYY